MEDPDGFSICLTIVPLMGQSLTEAGLIPVGVPIERYSGQLRPPMLRETHRKRLALESAATVAPDIVTDDRAEGSARDNLRSRC